MNNRFTQSDRDQLMMFSRTLGDNLDKNHEIYAFVKLLDTIDMNPFLSRYSHEGGKSYHPSLMLGVLLYGFHRGWRSSRELQKACEENDAMRYLVAGTACIDQEIRKLFRIFEKKYQKTFGNKKYNIDYNVVNYSSVLRHSSLVIVIKHYK